jgi:signal peptidase II
MSLPGWRNPFSFNVADIAIFLGALGLVLQPPEKKPAPRKRKATAKARTAAPQTARPQPGPAGGQAELPLDDKTRDEAGNSR